MKKKSEFRVVNSGEIGGRKSIYEGGLGVNYWKNKTRCLDGITKPSGAMGTEEQVGRVQEDGNM